MPIRVNCSCGKALAVKDELAGKAVKCPGCGQAVQIPKAAAAVAPSRGAVQAELSDLFDEEGLGQASGPVCPACAKPLRRADAVLCTHCGVNLQTGHRLVGHAQAIRNQSTHGHAQLDAAVDSMNKDIELQRRTMDVGMPWWFLLIMLTFVSGFGFVLVTIVNAATADAETTGLAKTIKDYAANRNVVIGCLITGAVIMFIARLWIVILSFMREFGEGIVAIFLYHKFLAHLFERPLIALIYTLGFFTMLSGCGLWIVNWLAN